jgi:parvulin-like peptidyl-prolyl isomerase
MTANKHQPNTKKVIRFACLAVFFLLAAVGCSRKEGDKAVSKDEKEKSAVVAKVGESRITKGELKSYLSKRPLSRRSEALEEEVDKGLDALILEEVLYQEALRLKLDQEPDVRERMRKMLTQMLIYDQINKKEWNREISAEELKDYYEKHQNEFNRPTQVRLADIFIAVPSGAAKGVREQQRKKAQQVLSEARNVKGQQTGLENLIRKYSDTPQKYRKGDTGFFDITGSPVGIDKQLAEAAFKLDKVGSLSDRVIETADGFHVVMLISKRDAVNQPLEAVQNQLKQRIRLESVNEARAAYIKKLKDSAAIDIDQNVLSGIVAELKQAQPARQPATRAQTVGPHLPPQPPLTPPGGKSGAQKPPGEKGPN